MAEPADSMTQITALRTALTALQTQQAALRTSQSNNIVRLSQPRTQPVYGSHSDGYGDHLLRLDQAIDELEAMSARWV